MTIGGSTRAGVVAIMVVAALAAAVEWLVGWRALAQAWVAAGPRIAPALAFLALSYLARAWRFQRYFGPRLAGRFGAVLRISAVHNLTNYVMPMRTGEAAFPLLMNREFGIPVVSATAALAWFRLLDLCVLVAVGRRPHTAGYGLEGLQLTMAGNAVKVDDQCRTSMRNVWAIGDLTGEPMLAHRAMAQAEVAVGCIAGHTRRFAPLAVPAICFTDPEVVAVGLTPADCAAAGIPCLSASFPFAANGRALSMDGAQGFVRVVARQDNHQVLGWQAVGPGVSELAAGFGLGIEMGARLEDVGGTIHAHPTLGEAVQEAALRALGRAVHV